jgi:Tfp pilus assembly protein PilF
MRYATRYAIRSTLLGGLLVLSQAGCINSRQTTSTLLDGVPPSDRPAPDLPAAESAKICMATADNLERASKDADAIGLYERARQLDPRQDAKATRQLAALYTRLGQFDRAKQEFDRALKQSPNDADLLNDLGYSYYCRGLWPEAEMALRKALSADSKHSRAWINLGMTLGQQGRYGESIDAFRQTVSPGKAYCNLAFVLTVQGKLDRARDAYRDALRIEPDLQLARTALEKLNEEPRPRPESVPTSRPARTLETAQPVTSDPSAPIYVPGPAELARTPR